MDGAIALRRQDVGLGKLEDVRLHGRGTHGAMPWIDGRGIREIIEQPLLLAGDAGDAAGKFISLAGQRLLRGFRLRVFPFERSDCIASRSEFVVFFPQLGGKLLRESPAFSLCIYAFGLCLCEFLRVLDPRGL